MSMQFASYVIKGKQITDGKIYFLGYRFASYVIKGKQITLFAFPIKDLQFASYVIKGKQITSFINNKYLGKVCQLCY